MCLTRTFCPNNCRPYDVHIYHCEKGHIVNDAPFLTLRRKYKCTMLCCLRYVFFMKFIEKDQKLKLF